MWLKLYVKGTVENDVRINTADKRYAEFGRRFESLKACGSLPVTEGDPSDEWETKLSYGKDEFAFQDKDPWGDETRSVAATENRAATTVRVSKDRWGMS